MNKRLNKSMTAAEFMEKMNKDSEFVKQRAEREASVLKAEAEYRAVQTLLLEELRRVGVDVESVWDLVNTAEPYPDALPVLLSHLQSDYPAPVKDGIARALAVPETRVHGWKLITNAYVEETDERVKQGLACAVAAAADDSVLSKIIQLAHDPRNGPSRVLLLNALRRSKDPRAFAALTALKSDPELAKEIQHILRVSSRRRRPR
jgi:hypothetical protein